MSSPSKMPVAYLAGPEVFLSNADEIAKAKKSICRQYGLDGVFPVDNTDPALHELPVDGHAIFRHCVEMMERSDLVIANMTPFRGPSMDIGTAVEVGFMYARGRPVFGYTNVTGDYGSRVQPDGMDIEAFGFFDNLMCEGPVFESGATVVRTDVAEHDLFTDLRGFEACVRQATRLLA